MAVAFMFCGCAVYTSSAYYTSAPINPRVAPSIYDGYSYPRIIYNCHFNPYIIRIGHCHATTWQPHR